MSSTITNAAGTGTDLLAARPRRVLLGAGLAHALHDGFTDAIYV